MSNYVVVDASLVVKWLLEEEDSQEARRLSERWSSTGIQPAAPRLLMYEIANTLHLKVRRGQTPIEEAWAAFDERIGFDIEFIDMESIRARAIEVATQRVG